MKSEHWKKLNEIIGQAMELPEEERKAFVEGACGEDVVLLEEARSLLEADSEASGFLRENDVLEEDGANRTGESIGAYRLLELLGRGGMGAVYRAERSDGAFEKEVAVKLMKPGVGSETWRRRFRTERHILGRLEHPRIATLLDGGNTEAGEPFLVMELVEGRPIDQYCQEEKLSVKERIILLEKVCGAVAFAHQNLVVHRDLKPGNVLVNQEGEPRLLDFGIAKMLEPDLLEVTVEATQTNYRPMSPSYASPEQIRGGAITTATDVWALGTLAYELLTGEKPYKSSSSLAELEVQRQSTPQTPSGVVKEPRERRQLKGDLDIIVLKALRADPERRYGTAADLGADFRRYLEGLPVQAQPDSWGYRMGKFVGRHRLPVGLGAVSLAVIVGLLVGLFFQAEDLRGERDKARQTVDLLVEVLGEASAQQNPGEEVTVREAMELGEPVMREKLKDQPELLGVVLIAIGTVFEEMSLLDEARSRLEESTRLLKHSGNERELSNALFGLGIVANWEHKFEEAERYFRKALVIRTELDGVESISAASTLQKIGVLQFQKGDNAESWSTLTRTSEILAKIPVPVLRQEKDIYFEARYETQSFLGKLKFREGKNREWWDHMETAIEIVENGFPENSVERAMAFNNIGVFYGETKEYQKAVDFMKKALSGVEAVWTSGHFVAATIRINISQNLYHLGKYESAVEIGREGQNALIEVFGEEHPEVGWATIHRARALAGAEKWSEVISLMSTPSGKAVLQSREGWEWMKPGWAILPLVKAFVEVGDFEQAEEVLHETVISETSQKESVASIYLARATLAEAMGELDTIPVLIKKAEEVWPEVPIPVEFEKYL